MGGKQVSVTVWCFKFQLQYGVLNCDMSMHEAKYQIPRDPDLRAAYRSSKFQRPKLKIHAAWAFGHVLRVAILEERTFHGSSMVRELLSLVLEDVMLECERTGRPRPHTCVVVGDNTVKELKNSTNLIYAAQLVQNNCLRLLGLTMLVVMIVFFIVCTLMYIYICGSLWG